MKKRKTYNQPKKVVGKTHEQKRNQIYAYILAFAMVFWTIASVIGIIGFVRTVTPSARAEGVVARRDSRVTERSIPSMLISLETSGATVADGFDTDTYLFANNDWYLEFTNDGIRFDTSFDNILLDFNGSIYVGDCVYSYNIFRPGGQNDIQSGTNSGYCSISYQPNNLVPAYYPSSSGGVCIPINIAVYYSLQNNYLKYTYEIFFCNEYGTQLGSSLLTLSFEDGIYGSSSYMLCYPSLDWTLNVAPNSGPYSGQVGTYDSIYYEFKKGYDSGFDEGYGHGFTEGRDEGLRVGYDEGYDIGRVDGFNDGVASADKNTFYNLFASIFDVPVQTFTSLFNFEVLGVNLSGFFFSILTIGIILAVVKWLLP